MKVPRRPASLVVTNGSDACSPNNSPNNKMRPRQEQVHSSLVPTWRFVRIFDGRSHGDLTCIYDCDSFVSSSHDSLALSHFLGVRQGLPCYGCLQKFQWLCNDITGEHVCCLPNALRQSCLLIGHTLSTCEARVIRGEFEHNTHSAAAPT